MLFSCVETCDTFLVKKSGTLHHPGTGMAAVCHDVEVSTFEILLVEIIEIFKLQEPILKDPVTIFLLSMPRVPDENYKKKKYSLLFGGL